MFQIILKVIFTEVWIQTHKRLLLKKNPKKVLLLKNQKKVNRYSKCTALISKYYKSTFNTAGMVHKGEKLFTVHN